LGTSLPTSSFRTSTATKGTLVYRGSLDNSWDGKSESAPDGRLVNHVDKRLAELAADGKVGFVRIVDPHDDCGIEYAD
jgi:hypothetical protein